MPGNEPQGPPKADRCGEKISESGDSVEKLVAGERLAAISSLARGIGHELGNLLLKIMGKTDLALLENDPARIHDHLRVVISAAERAGMIVRNLQSFTLVPPALKPGNVSEAFERAASLIVPELTRGGVVLEKDLAPSAARIDPRLLSQAFANILVNAGQASPAGAVVKARISVEGASVVVVVRDSGPGIAREAMPRIFEFGFTTRADRGAGLGLPVAREIVGAHGGSIEVESEPGQGTVVTIRLPAEGLA